MTSAPGPGSASPPTFVVAAVCLRDERGRVLTVRKRGTASFMLPGGKLEPGESALEAGRREVREEVGLEVDALTLLGRYVADAANEPGHLVDSTVFTAVLPGVPRASGEIEELHWYDPTSAAPTAGVRLAPLLVGHVLPALRSLTRDRT